MKHKIFPLGDGALTVEYGSEISVETNNRVLNLARYFDANSFAGFIEIVPAYGSLTVFYDVSDVRKTLTEFPSAFAAVKDFVEKSFENTSDFQETKSRLIEIPVCFDAEFALDLDFVASENNLSPKQVVEIFLGKRYRVFMLGFLPGFSYMGEVDKKIAVPRKAAPRLRVPAGSVGIAGTQTGIYSLASPGGWQIIGQTPIELFLPNTENPTFLRAGDSVKFYPIEKQDFTELRNEN
jgi:inhibitor of KinA